MFKIFNRVRDLEDVMSLKSETSEDISNDFSDMTPTSSASTTTDQNAAIYQLSKMANHNQMSSSSSTTTFPKASPSKRITLDDDFITSTSPKPIIYDFSPQKTSPKKEATPLKPASYTSPSKQAGSAKQSPTLNKELEDSVKKILKGLSSTPMSVREAQIKANETENSIDPTGDPTKWKLDENLNINEVFSEVDFIENEMMNQEEEELVPEGEGEGEEGIFMNVSTNEINENLEVESDMDSENVKLEENEKIFL